MPKCILAEQNTGISVIPQSIEITAPPNKTSYLSGEAFDTTGMVVTANYIIDSTFIVTIEIDNYSVSPAILTDEVTSVTIAYSESGVTCTATQAVTVAPSIAKIEVTTNPTTTSYVYGDTLSIDGMVVTATYSNGVTKTINNYTYGPTELNKVGNQVITISYTEDGITRTTTFTVTVGRKPVPVPTWKSNLVYNGSLQSVNDASKWDNYNPEYIAIGGTASATDAGIYTVVFTPKNNYCWESGYVTDIKTLWEMVRATGSSTVSKSSITLNSDTKSDTFTVDRLGDGEITVESSDTTVATASISGTTVTVSSVNDKTGTATITVKVAEGRNYTAPSDKTVDVSCEFLPAVGTPLSDMSWEDIRKISDAGVATNYFAVGDTKTITLNGTAGSLALNNFSCQAFIIGFDHNSNYEGSNRIHFQIGKKDSRLIAFYDDRYGINVNDKTHFSMNSYNTNEGGWNLSLMRITLGNTNTPSNPGTNTFLSVLPSDLRAVMKSCNKYTQNGYDAQEMISLVTSTTDYLFLLSEFEYFGRRSYATVDYQVQYDYYKAGNSKRHYRYNDKTTVIEVWERSPYEQSIDLFCTLVGESESGTASYAASNTSQGISPAFCV